MACAAVLRRVEAAVEAAVVVVVERREVGAGETAGEGDPASVRGREVQAWRVAGERRRCAPTQPKRGGRAVLVAHESAVAKGSEVGGRQRAAARERERTVDRGPARSRFLGEKRTHARDSRGRQALSLRRLKPAALAVMALGGERAPSSSRRRSVRLAFPSSRSASRQKVSRSSRRRIRRPRDAHEAAAPTARARIAWLRSTLRLD